MQPPLHCPPAAARQQQTQELQQPLTHEGLLEEHGATTSAGLCTALEVLVLGHTMSKCSDMLVECAKRPGLCQEHTW